MDFKITIMNNSLFYPAGDNAAALMEMCDASVHCKKFYSIL
jgi:hypothetical protein